MINKELLTRYVRIISGCDGDTNRTLVDFSLDAEKRNVVNLVNEEAKKDKGLAKLLDDLKYSNNKMKLIDEYFKDAKDVIVRNYSKEKIDNYGFINLSSLSMIIGAVVLALTVVIAIGS